MIYLVCQFRASVLSHLICLFSASVYSQFVVGIKSDGVYDSSTAHVNKFVTQSRSGLPNRPGKSV